MCTVSWARRADGYDLLFNRDELRTRKTAQAPRCSRRSAVRVIRPYDGDHGGSWIGVNEFGLSLCLLNRYDESPARQRPAPVSRGLLLEALLDSTSQQAAGARVLAADLSPYRPFTLLAIGLEAPPVIVDWTGSACRIDRDGERRHPLSSSSCRNPEVVESRRRCFERRIGAAGMRSPAPLFGFHASHEPERGPGSVCMHREDAETVSFSWIRATKDAIAFLYWPKPPCTLPMTGGLEAGPACRGIVVQGMARTAQG